MEANKQAQEIAMELVHNIDEDHRAEWSKLDGMIKHRDEKLQEISVELDAKNAEIQSLVAQRDKNFGLLELMKAKENELNTLLAERETILTNLKVSLQTRDDEILSLKAINDRIIKEKDDIHHRFIKEKEEMPVTKKIENMEQSPHRSATCIYVGLTIPTSFSLNSQSRFALPLLSLSCASLLTLLTSNCFPNASSPYLDDPGGLK